MGPGEERSLGLSVSGLEDSGHEVQGLGQRFSPGWGDAFPSSGEIGNTWGHF